SSADDPHLVLAFVLDSAPSGDYVITVPLTNGATLTATFTHTAAGSSTTGSQPVAVSTPSPTAAASSSTPMNTPAARHVQFLQRHAPGSLPPGVLGSPRTDRWFYTFRISGPAINGPTGGANGSGVTLQPSVSFGWGRTNDPNLIWVSLDPSTAA